MKPSGFCWESPITKPDPSRNQPFHRRVASKLPQPLQVLLGSSPLLELIERLISISRNVNTLKIHSFYDNSLPIVVQIVGYALKCLGPRLDTLSFHGPISIFSKLIEEFGVGRKLPRLHVFRTVLVNEPYETSYIDSLHLKDSRAHAVKHWCRFLSTVSPSLHSLDISTDRFYTKSMASYPYFFETVLESFHPTSLHTFSLHVPEELIPPLPSRFISFLALAPTAYAMLTSPHVTL